MKYDLSGFLDSYEKSYHLEGEIDNESFSKDNNIKIIDPIKFNGEIFKVDRELLVQVTIWYTYISNCDRCLNPTTSEITTILSGKLEEAKGKFDDDDCDDELDEIIFYENNLLNLEEYILSQVISSLPMKNLCSDDCKGLCPKCGNDLNTQSCDCMKNIIDPRLEKLMEFFPKK